MRRRQRQTPWLTYPDAVQRVRGGQATSAEVTDLLLEQLDDDELLWLLDGDTPVRSIIGLPKKMKAGPITGGAIARIGFPGIRFSDGPRGVVMGASTAFPVTMARASTWDRDLEERVGLAMGLEARAGGANYSGAVCVNLLRHPAWGRAQECYGEDPVLTGQLGAALTRGIQTNVIACVKHFALNSMENARFEVDVQVDEHALHEVYLPHFKTVIDAGADSVMSAYNSVNGAFAGENSTLLSDVLRDEWGFDGIVTSDWVYGVRDAVVGLEAGLDMEMPARLRRARALPDALREGTISRELVLRSARRVVGTVLRHEAGRATDEPQPDVVASAEHRALAREVAARGSVLLENKDRDGTSVLPLDPSVRSIAVIGTLAAHANTGDHGSSLVHPPSTVSILQGLREALPGVAIAHHDGSDPAAAAALAGSCDAAVVVAGMSHDDEGERIENDDAGSLDIFGFPLASRPVRWLMGKLAANQFGRGGDRDSLTLHPGDEHLVLAVAAANQRSTVVMIGGSAIITESWRDQIGAILMAWYPGMEGGRAVADVLTGRREPGGRLPVAFPVSGNHLPHFNAEATEIVYGDSWGQRKLDRDGNPAAYPFGFGLGYTTFEIELVGHRADDIDGEATVRVRNVGERAGSTVAQVYAVDTDAPRPVPQLIGFARVDLAAGSETQVLVALDVRPTQEREPTTRTWSRRDGSWQIAACAHSPLDVRTSVPLFGSDPPQSRGE